MNTPSSFGEKAIRFYRRLEWPDGAALPPGVLAMNPYQDAETLGYARAFLKKFFSDSRKRIFAFGINPGRRGGGATGVNFTDPVALEKFCGIANDLPKVRESSSEFVYRFIGSWGGAEKFYRDFFLTAASPLGFVREGKNYNYYDDKKLFSAARSFIIASIRSHIDFGADRKNAIIFGTGKNRKIFEELNAEYGFFSRIHALEHPRFIMQYRRKKIQEYIEKYTETFSRVL